MKKIALLGLLCVWSLSAFSARLYVGVGQTYTTISAAIAAAGSGDEIYIKNGTYTPSSTLVISSGFPLTIRGESATGVIISGVTAGRVFSVRGGGLPWLPGSTLYLNRVTITNASATGNGGGLEFQSGSLNGSTVDSVIFTNCSATGNGGAIYADTRVPKLSECLFSGNSSGGDGGAVYFDIKSGSPQNTITNCTFDSNSSTGNGAGLAIKQGFNVTITINNSTFGGHSSSSGKGAIFLQCNASGAKLDIRNSTIANNDDGGFKIINTSAPVLNLYNDLFDNNAVDITSSSSQSTSSEGSIVETYSNVILSASSNILGTHPKLLVASSLSNYGQFTKSYALTSYGVAIAADAASSAFSNSTGQNGETRGTPDIGSYEFDETLIYRWKGTGTSDWATGSNWSTGVVPPFATRPEFVIIEKCTSTSNTPTASSGFIVPSKLIIREDGALDLSGSAYVYVDTLLILSNEEATSGKILTGQLKAQVGSFTIVGETHIQQFLNGNQWNFLGSISGAGIAVQDLVPGQTFSSDDTDTNGDYWVARYDEVERATNGATGNEWIYVTSGTSLAAATGYIVWADRDMRAVFNTYDPSNDKSVNLSYTTSALDDKEKGWNLVGNPFICPVDWDQFTNPGGKIDEAMYYYSSQYQTYFTYAAGVFDPVSGRGKVPPAQSIFVKTNTDGASMTFTTAMQTIDPNSTFYKSSSMDANELVKLSIHSPDTFFFDETFIRHKELATANYDGLYDGYKLLTFNPIVPQLYSYFSDENFSINSINMEETNENVFPLSYKNLMLDSTYKVAFTQRGDELGLTYVLEDTELGMSYTLTDGDTIEIVPTVTSSDIRFVLKSYQFVVDMPKQIEGKVFAYSQPGRIIVNFDGEMHSGDLSLYDISGKIVKKEKVLNYTGNYTFSGLKAGIYIVHYNGENKGLTEKVIVR